MVIICSFLINYFFSSDDSIKETNIFLKASFSWSMELDFCSWIFLYSSLLYLPATHNSLNLFLNGLDTLLRPI